MIEIKSLIEIILVVAIVKLVVTQYRPPIQKSLCALVCIALGVILGLLIDPSTQGLTNGIIGAGFGFYGGELFLAFKMTTEQLQKLKINK